MEIIIRDRCGRITESQREIIRQLIDEALEQVDAGMIEDFNQVCERMKRRCSGAEI